MDILLIIIILFAVAGFVVNLVLSKDEKDAGAEPLAQPADRSGSAVSGNTTSIPEAVTVEADPAKAPAKTESTSTKQAKRPVKRDRPKGAASKKSSRKSAPRVAPGKKSG